MGAHPNVILKCTIKVDSTTRKTLREMLAVNRAEVPDDQLPLMLDNEGGTIENSITGSPVRESRDDSQLAIGGHVYYALAMESDYDEGWQLAGSEGDILVFDLVTYGYGESISWEELTDRTAELRTWCAKHGYVSQIEVTANYW